MRDQRTHLNDLLAELVLVARFTQSGKAAFMADERDQYAVMMAYARIGEVIKQIDDSLLAQHPHVQWKQIKGFRDVLMHRYFDINIERVWEAVEDLPTLRAAVEAMIANLPPEDEG